MWHTFIMNNAVFHRITSHVIWKLILERQSDILAYDEKGKSA